MKRCARCHEEKPESEYNKASSAPDGLSYYCRACWKLFRRENYERHGEQHRANAKTYYADHSEERKDYAHRYQAVNRAAVLAGNRVRAQRTKTEAFNAYGGPICACCGETTLAFLTIDHIDGCTADERKVQGVGTRMYYWLKKNAYPAGFQVLCFNCNLGRRVNGGECPHQA